MGMDALALALKVPRHLLEAWLYGHATMPDRKLLMLIDALERLDRGESRPDAVAPAPRPMPIFMVGFYDRITDDLVAEFVVPGTTEGEAINQAKSLFTERYPKVRVAEYAVRASHESGG